MVVEVSYEPVLKNEIFNLLVLSHHKNCYGRNVASVVAGRCGSCS